MSIKTKEYEDFGGNVPAFDNKQPMSLRDIQTSQWRSLGNGRVSHTVSALDVARKNAHGGDQCLGR